MDFANWKERMRITKEGNVGIGTTSPSRRLHVHEENANSYVQISNNHSSGQANNILEFFEGSTLQASLIARGSGIAGGPPNALNIYTHVSGAPITLGTASGEIMRITGIGNVGIGTTMPAASLVIKDDILANVLFQNTDTGGTATDGFFVGIDTEKAYLWNYENSDMTFGTNSTTRMTIEAGGNVGIGTQSPQSALQVSGYTQLDVLTIAPPPSTDCDEGTEAGRMKFDAVNDLLYICSGVSGWVTK